MNFKHNITSNYHMFFHQAGSCQMEGIISLYNYIMTYLVAILFVVTTALVFIITVHLHGQRHVHQYKTEKNINDLIEWQRYLQKWTHSTILELVWTIIPTLILIAIAVPSFILLYSLDEIVDTQCVVKIIAYQWYWKYEYPVLDPLSDEIFSFSYLSYMLPLENLTTQNNLWLLEVDTPLVLPTNVNAKLIITSKDVIHSFAVPALGIKMDAVPGWLNQVTVHIFKSGIFYGQCSELCGVNHAFMPIVVNAVNFNTFEIFLWECAEITAKKFLTPFSSINHIMYTSEDYKAILAFLATIKNEELSTQFLVSNVNLRDELLARTQLTLNRDEKILNPDVFKFLNERVLDWILILENELLATLPENNVAHTLNLGKPATGERVFTSGPANIANELLNLWPTTFNFAITSMDDCIHETIVQYEELNNTPQGFESWIFINHLLLPMRLHSWVAKFDESLLPQLDDFFMQSPKKTEFLTFDEFQVILDDPEGWIYMEMLSKNIDIAGLVELQQEKEKELQASEQAIEASIQKEFLEIQQELIEAQQERAKEFRESMKVIEDRLLEIQPKTDE